MTIMYYVSTDSSTQYDLLYTIVMLVGVIKCTLHVKGLFQDSKSNHKQELCHVTTHVQTIT